MEIYSTLSGILVKIGLLNKSARDPVTAIITVVDFIVAWICNWKYSKLQLIILLAIGIIGKKV